MSIQYIHIRPGVHYDTTAKKLVGEPLPKGGYTVAFTADGSNLDIAVARCRDTDSYSRKTGRAIAGGRLTVGKVDIYASVEYDATTGKYPDGVVAKVVDHVGRWLENREAFFGYLT